MTTARLAALSLGLGLGSIRCQGPCDQWLSPETLALGVTDDLHGIDWVVGGYPSNFVAVGAAGVVVEYEDFYGLSGAPEIQVDHPVAVDLRAVTRVAADIVAVGDRGAVVRRPNDGEAWEIVDVGVTADLHAILDTSAEVIVAGDDVVLVRALDAASWTVLPAPDGGWGPLRAVLHNDAEILVVGLGGVAWSTTTPMDPLVPWQRRDLGTTADLLAGDEDVLVGAAGTLLVRRGADWLRGDVPADADLIAAAATPRTFTSDPRVVHLLAADGRVFDLDLEDRTTLEIDDLGPGLAGLVTYADGSDTIVFAAGRSGAVQALQYKGCEYE